MGLHLDVNYHFKTEGFLQVAKAVAPFDMTWLEIDTWDPQSLALIRRQAPCPIASLESVTGRRRSGRSSTRMPRMWRSST